MMPRHHGDRDVGGFGGRRETLRGDVKTQINTAIRL